MRIFVTGATGFIGSAVVRELIGAGHDVLGLTRSAGGVQSLKAAGANALEGKLEDLDILRRGASTSDAVIHAGFNHDFSKFLESCEWDRKVIEALGSALIGSDRPLLVTSVIGAVKAEEGQLATESSEIVSSKTFPRAASEEAAAAVLALGCRVITMRNSQIHDTRKQGLVTELISIDREKGRSAYVEEGLNRWAATHVSDTARLYRLAIEKGTAGAKYHAVAEEGPTFRQLAEVVGTGIGIPVVALNADEAKEHFGWFMKFAALKMTASSEQTRSELNWNPTGPTILTDLCNMDYAAE